VEVFEVDFDPIQPLVVVEDVFAQVLVDDKNNLLRQHRPRLQVFVQVEQVQNVENSILVDVKNFEAQTVLLLLVVASERQQVFNEIANCDPGAVEAI